MFRESNFLENFKTQKWNNLTFEERLASLQELENAIAKEQGRQPRQVEADCFRRNTSGYYNPTDCSYIHINPNYLNSTDNSGKLSSYDAMDTIIHEGRHAYQHDAINGLLSNHQPNQELINDWDIDTKNPFNANQQDKVKEYVDYRFKPKENDAYDYAFNKMQSFAHTFQGDLNYDLYNKRQNNRLLKETDLGKEQYGENFVQVIKDNKYAMESQKTGRNQILATPVKTDSNSLLNDTGIYKSYEKTNPSVPTQGANTEIEEQQANTPVPMQGTSTEGEEQQTNIPVPTQGTSTEGKEQQTNDYDYFYGYGY